MYNIRENVTFNRVEEIEKAEIKCTFSNGKEAIINIPHIIDGSFIHKGDMIIQDPSTTSFLAPDERINEYLQFNFQFFATKRE